MPTENEKAVMITDTAAHFDQEESEDAAINFVGLLFDLLEKAKYIILFAVICAAVGGMLSRSTKPADEFQSTAQMIVAANPAQPGAESAHSTTYYYMNLLQSQWLNEQVISNLQLSYTYTALRGMLTTESPNNSSIFNITITSPDAEEAVLIANEYAKVLLDYLTNVEKSDKLSLHTAATESIKLPNQGSSTLSGAIKGGLIGGLLSIVVIVALYIFNDKVHSTDNLARSMGLPTLAIIPMADEATASTEEKKQGGRK